MGDAVASDAWLEKMDKVESFVKDVRRLPTKNHRIPRAEREPREREIENWLPDQRKNRRRLDSHQVARLEALPGFLWNPQRNAWKANVKGYGNFFLKHGKRPSDLSNNSREKRLADWGSEQRNLRREANGRNAPTPQRIAELEAIPGWEWATPMAEVKQSRIDELAAFVDTFERRPKSWRGVKDKRPLTAEEEREHSLNVWLSKRQELARKGQLDSVVWRQIEAALKGPLI